MKILGFEIGIQKAVESVAVIETQAPTTREAKASLYSNIIPLNSQVLSFNGEKNLGDMGPIISYIPDYYGLSERAWQAYMESDLARTVIDKWESWIIDVGLKLKANPQKIVLNSEGIAMSKDGSESFNDTVESRFEVWSRSKKASISGEETFNEITKSIFIHSKIGGDCLTVLRYVDGCVKVQKIEGSRVQNPMPKQPTQSNNTISNGVEKDTSGKVVGYHVRHGNTFDFIPAYSSETGLRVAFLVMGTKWRMGYDRGLPVIATALESLKKIERYREATIGSAEEVAKITYQVVHQNYSDNSSPLANQLARATNIGGENQIPTDSLGDAFADRLAITTGKQAFNNTKGARIEAIDHGNGLSGFKEFYSTNADIICSAVGIPPNVALSIYNDSFSASRAATKDWDHSMDVERDTFANQYYKYVYQFWLFTEILKGKVKAPGYLLAFLNNEWMITEAYENARFTGPHFPHIDPKKEADAARILLGELGKNIPLSTVEQETESLGKGDSDSNIEQFSDEYSVSKELGLLTPPKEQIVSIPADPKASK